MLRVKSRLLPAFIGLIAGMLSTGKPACAQGSWTYIFSPNPSPEHSVLSGIAAASASDIWSVGSYDANPDPYETTNRTLIEHWDGNQWSIVPSPDVGPGWNALEAVAVVNAENVWAVGYWSEPNG